MSETHSEIRDAVRALCRDFPGVYWRQCDRDRAYPTEFVTALTDAISTSCFMSMLGPEQESNFIVRDLAFYYGIYAGPALGKIYQLFAVWGLSVIAPRLTRLVCIVVIAINLFATGINITVYLQALKDAAAAATQ